jgi:hypothetical protein
VKKNEIRFIETRDQYDRAMEIIAEAHQGTDEQIEAVPAVLYHAVTDYLERLVERTRLELQANPNNEELQNDYLSMHETVAQAKAYLDYV